MPTSAGLARSGLTVPEAFAAALSHRRNGQLAEAEAIYRAILTVDPDHAETHDALGSMLAARGEVAEARARFENAIALAPMFAEAHYHLGDLLRGLGLAADAVTSYQRAIALKPDLPAALHALRHATAFFHDLDVFECLTDRMRLQLNAATLSGAGTVRIWVPACSTGEEVYSLAILMDELMSGMSAAPGVELIGTDISINVLQRARTGRYRGPPPATISEQRLQRFFVSTSDSYQVCDRIREMCVFFRHDLTEIPPISDVDLLSCRNVLGFFFEPKVRDRILELFHAVLKPNGCLVLGKREILDVPETLFAPVDRQQMIFTRN